MLAGSRLLIITVALSVLIACGGAGATGGNNPSPSPTTATSNLQRAGLGIATLQSWYEPSTGLYRTTGWWNSANAMTALADYARVSKSTAYNSVFASTLGAAQTGSRGLPGFINKYYDDEGWWALAWIDVYDVTGDSRYLAAAEAIFSDMTTGWDSVCAGGLWWNKDRQYKNAIANELFLSVAAHLANRDAQHRSEYLDWANKEWMWFARSGMINAQNLINDGLDIGAGSCTNNGRTTWTYNQGVVLGGLAELSKLSSDPSLPEAGQKIATAAIAALVDRDGILHDPCEPNCGGDGVQFKGIFLRNLVRFQTSYPQATFKQFVQKNATSIWERAQGANYTFGQVWSGPFDAATAATQSSALDAIVGAAFLEGE